MVLLNARQMTADSTIGKSILVKYRDYVDIDISTFSASHNYFCHFNVNRIYMCRYFTSITLVSMSIE